MMMNSFFVNKIEWEQGEASGDICYPETLTDLQTRISSLDEWAKIHNYPFLINVFFSEHHFSLAFTVGHYWSFMEFAYEIDPSGDTWKGPFYLSNPYGREDEIIPFYYRGFYTEPDTRKLLPQGKVLKAVYHFVENKKFTHDITFDNEEVNSSFIER